jgi:hypothetical protein
MAFRECDCPCPYCDQNESEMDCTCLADDCIYCDWERNKDDNHKHKGGE